MDKEKKEYDYVQSPLCLLRETYRNVKTGTDLFFDFGIVNYAKTKQYTMTAVAVQLIYDFYRRSDRLQSGMTQKICNAIDQDKFSDFREDNPGFNGKKFDPASYDNPNVEELLSLFKSDSELKETAILNYQIYVTTSKRKNSLSLKISDLEIIINNYYQAKQIKQEFEDNFGPDAMPSVKTDILFDMGKNTNNIDLLRAYIGILSLIGQRSFISTSKPVILSRMIGAKSKDAYKFFSEDPIIKKTIDKYKNRYWMDKLLTTLAERKFIMYLARKHDRKLYVSKYMSPMELSELIKSRQFTFNLKKKQNEALQHLYNTTS